MTEDLMDVLVTFRSGATHTFEVAKNITVIDFMALAAAFDPSGIADFVLD